MTDKYEESFQNLKTLLTTMPILTLLAEGHGFIVYCDDSHLRFCVVLMDDKNVKAYASGKLKTH